VVLLAEQLRTALARVPGAALHDLGQERCGIVTFTKAGTTCDALCRALQAQAINTHVSRLASTRLDMAARGLDTVLRASLHYYNDDAEIERFVAAVRAL